MTFEQEKKRSGQKIYSEKRYSRREGKTSIRCNRQDWDWSIKKLLNYLMVEYETSSFTIFDYSLMTADDRGSTLTFCSAERYFDFIYID